jgi:hypothetical protein
MRNRLPNCERDYTQNEKSLAHRTLQVLIIVGFLFWHALCILLRQ